MKQRALLIAEKPSLKRTIEAVYKKHQDKIPYDITFMEQRGHLLTLKLPNELDESLVKWTWETLPIHPEEHGGWQYKVISDKKVGNFLTCKERFAAIKNELNNNHYDFIINAGDPDQEGELLVRIVLSALGTKLPVKRYWSNDTTEFKVLDALIHLKDDDNDPMLTNLLKAAYGRQHSDYRFGFNISRAATLKMNYRVACGRVKTPILGMVCKRDIEIKNFTPSTCYGVRADFAPGFSGQLFERSSLNNQKDNEDGKKDGSEGLIWFENASEAEELKKILATPQKVVNFDSQRVESYAPKLFKLASAQIAAGKMGYTASQTLSIIQGLYDKGYMSYPRTDCEYISSKENLPEMLRSAASVPELAPFVEKISKETIGKVRGTKKWANDKALADAGHSALVPTTKAPDFNSLTDDEKRIYALICRQFVAIFLPPLIQDKTQMITSSGDHYFRSNGKTLVSAGYTEIFNTKFTDTQIPKYKEGDYIDVDSYETIEKTTTCPKRFTDADLIAACEVPHKFLNDESLKSLGKRLKIGTSATRAGIIEELITRDKYLERKKEGRTVYIVPTDVGMSIYQNLKDCDICKIDMTGEWELKLEEIRSGNRSLDEFEHGMMHDVESMILDIKNSDMGEISRYKEHEVIAKCPKCGGDIKSGQKGFYCSNYKEKECHVGAAKKICDSELSDAEFLTLLSGKEIEKSIKKGIRSWKQKLCYDLDECKLKFVEEVETDAGYRCPKCSSELSNKGNIISCSSCSFKFYKTVGTNSKELTDEQIRKFFNEGNTGLVKKIRSKKGTYFDAYIKLKDDKTGTEFEFPAKTKEK